MTMVSEYGVITGAFQICISNVYNNNNNNNNFIATHMIHEW